MYYTQMLVVYLLRLDQISSYKEMLLLVMIQGTLIRKSNDKPEVTLIYFGAMAVNRMNKDCSRLGRSAQNKLLDIYYMDMVKV